VKFYYNPELDNTVAVREDGNISLSLIGEIKAEGKTPQQLSNEITEAYREYLKRPNATVIVNSTVGHRIYVLGEVFKPGLLEIQGPETILSSLSSAGGVTDNGHLNQVVLVRRVPSQEQPIVVVLDLDKALSGADPRQDMKVHSHDIIYVPKDGDVQNNLDLKHLLWDKIPFTGSANVGWTAPMH